MPNPGRHEGMEFHYVLTGTVRKNTLERMVALGCGNLKCAKAGLIESAADAWTPALIAAGTCPTPRWTP